MYDAEVFSFSFVVKELRLPNFPFEIEIEYMTELSRKKIVSYRTEILEHEKNLLKLPLEDKIPYTRYLPFSF